MNSDIHTKGSKVFVASYVREQDAFRLAEAGDVKRDHEEGESYRAAAKCSKAIRIELR